MVISMQHTPIPVTQANFVSQAILQRAQGKTVQCPGGHLGLQLPFGQMAKQELEFNIIAYLVKTGGLEPILDMTRLMVMKNGHIAVGSLRR